jgi:hypothetical protein
MTRLLLIPVWAVLMCATVFLGISTLGRMVPKRLVDLAMDLDNKVLR